MGRKCTTEEFIKKAIRVHGDKYDYSKVEYISCSSSIHIVCRSHGEFKQKPVKHLLGKGCRKCGEEGKERKWDESSFREAVSKRLPNLDFTKTKFENFLTNVIYSCPIHGDKSSSPSNLFKITGCKNCQRTGGQTSKEEWVKVFNEVHGDKYNYSITNSNILNDKKIQITCPIHGIFKQWPAHHKKGVGCPECSNLKKRDRLKKNAMGWTYSSWEKAAKKSKDFDSYKVYIIFCWGEGEEFFKIGRTYKEVEKRFVGKKAMPYKYRVLKVEEYEDAIKACEKEEKMKKENKESKYIPKLKFNGMYECFKEIKDKI